MEPDDSMAISTSARTFGGYFRPRWEPFTVFLQYARLAIVLPPLCRKTHTFALRRACFVPLSLPRPTAQNYCGHFARSSFLYGKQTGSPQPHHAMPTLYQRYSSPTAAA